MYQQPEYLTKDRLKGELKKHGVSFSPSEMKDYYVQLYKKHVLRGKGKVARSEFSSDEELTRQSPRLAKKQTPQAKRPTKVVKTDTYLTQVTQMSDKELVEQLRKFGEDPGPITDTTKGVYQRKLAKHLAEKTVASSHAREEVDYGGDYIGEWSSGSGGESEEGEEDENAKSSPPRKRVHKSYSTAKHVYVESSYLREKVPPSHQQEEKEERPPPPKRIIAGKGGKKTVKQPPVVEHDVQRSPASDSGSSPWSFLCSFLLLVVAFIVVFFAYDYYSLGDKGMTYDYFTRARTAFFAFTQGKVEEDDEL